MDAVLLIEAPRHHERVKKKNADMPHKKEVWKSEVRRILVRRGAAVVVRPCSAGRETVMPLRLGEYKIRPRRWCGLDVQPDGFLVQRLHKDLHRAAKVQT